MILARIQQQSHQSITLTPRQKSTTLKFRSRGHSTHMTYSQRSTIDQHSRQSSPQQWGKMTLNKFRQQPEETDGGGLKTCSNFMKSYVDKLKKQRKRERKRVSQANQNKIQEREAAVGCDVAPLPLIHHGQQQILIFQRVSNPATFRSNKIQHTPSESTIGQEKIEEIISQIKFHKEMKEKQAKKRMKEALPTLNNLKTRSLKKNINLIELNPWESDHTQNDMLFEAFR